MPKRSSKPDINQIAASIVDRSTAETRSGGAAVNSIHLLEPYTTVRDKNPAAVELGRLGGLKGGKIRAQNLSPERRKKIASKAAKARWKKRKQRN